MGRKSWRGRGEVSGRRRSRVSGSARDCLRGAAVLAPPGPGSLGGSGRGPACSSSREGGRLQGGAGLARPPGDAVAAALRPGSAGCCGSRTPEAQAVSELRAGAGRVFAGPRSSGAAPEGTRATRAPAALRSAQPTGRSWDSGAAAAVPGLEVRSCLRHCAQYRRRSGQLNLYRALVRVGGEPLGAPHSCPFPAVFDLSVLFTTIP